MFNHFPQSEVDIVDPDGTVRSRVKALVDSKGVTIPDPIVMILAGDEIRRMVPNGTEEVFEVVEVEYRDRFHAIPTYLFVEKLRKGEFPAKTGGNYNFHVSGPNVRINFHCVDNSQNKVSNNNLFNDLRQAFQSAVTDPNEGKRIKNLIDAIEVAKGDDRRLRFNDFIQQAANYMTIAAPFLPALTDYIE